MIIKNVGTFEDFLAAKEAMGEGDFEKAIFYLRRAKRREPSKISVREALGRCYFNVGDYRKAESEFRFIVNKKPDEDYAYFGLGLSLVKQGKREEGVENLKIACALNPSNVDYSNYLKKYSE